MDWQAICAIAVPIIFVLAGLSYKYGALNVKVKNNCEVIAAVKKSNDDTHKLLFEKLNKIDRTVGRIEGTLNGKRK